MEHFRGGFITVITGPMFAGKTEELMRMMRRWQIARKRVVVFKPLRDDRYAKDQIVTHNGEKIDAIVVAKAADLLKHLQQEEYSDVEIIGVDEVQFFDVLELIKVVKDLANQGKKVVMAALDLAASGQSFPGMAELLVEADVIKKLHAICSICGSLASRTHRLGDSKELIEVGGKEKYQALCRACWYQFNKDRN